MTAPDPEFVTWYDIAKQWLESPEPGTHVDGIAWCDAPIPSRWHLCKAQTTGFSGMSVVKRCACGAINLDGTGWAERNSRRRGARHRR